MNGRLRVRRSSLSSRDSSRPPLSKQLGVGEEEGSGVAEPGRAGVIGSDVCTTLGTAGEVAGAGLATGVGDDALPAHAESQRERQARGRRLFIVKRKPANRRMAAGRRGRLLHEVYADWRPASSRGEPRTPGWRRRAPRAEWAGERSNHSLPNRDPACACGAVACE
jgi:hypothetical protein